MINVSTITAQVVDWFSTDPELSGYYVTRSEFVNEDPGKASRGWIGVYRRSVDYDPRNLGVAPNNYEGTVTFDIVVQRTHMGSGQEAEDALEESVKKVLDRLVQIPKDYIDHISDMFVEYAYLESDRTTLYFQAALITITAEVHSEVT